jgi:hypothetical protein
MSECKVTQVWPIYRSIGKYDPHVSTAWELVEEHQGDLDSAYARAIQKTQETGVQHSVVPDGP